MSDFGSEIKTCCQDRRFRPLSTADRPQQYLKLEQRWPTTIQSTVDRILPLVGGPEKIFIATSDRYRNLVRQQRPGIAAENLIIEPEGRDSAPAIALASLTIAQKFGGQTVAGFFSSDQRNRPIDPVPATIKTAAGLARDRRRLVIIGIKPDRAATGYG